MERETATFTCPKCRRQSRVLADEYGDHGCPCGWDPAEERLREDIRRYVKRGGWDAFSFSLLASPLYGDVPGRVIQRIINEIKSEEADE